MAANNTGASIDRATIVTIKFIIFQFHGISHRSKMSL
jgi:hypothetical protein